MDCAFRPLGNTEDEDADLPLAEKQDNNMTHSIVFLSASSFLYVRYTRHKTVELVTRPTLYYPISTDYIDTLSSSTAGYIQTAGGSLLRAI